MYALDVSGLPNLSICSKVYINDEAYSFKRRFQFIKGFEKNKKKKISGIGFGTHYEDI